MEQQTQTRVVYVSKKSTGVAFLLTFLFGPLGLLYVSPVGGIILFIVGVLSFFVLPIIGGIIIWIISIIWAVTAASNSGRI